MRCISPIYVRKQQSFVPCGKCAFCIKKSINGWCTRIRHEMEISSSAFFITLTYNEEHIPRGHSHQDCINSHLDNEVCKRDLMLFLKRLRKRNEGIRYFAIGEYGTEGQRPHYHLVLFNVVDLQSVTDSWVDQDGLPIGFVSGSKLTMGRVRYCVSYMAYPAPIAVKQKPFRVMSRRPGLGDDYIPKMESLPP